jgi:hypothetical protein
MDDQPVLDPEEGRSAMLTVDATATLVPSRPLTDDELTDLIATVIDYLDTRVIDPSVSTVREGSGVRVEVTVVIDTDDPWHAQALAVRAMRDAFKSATPGMGAMTHDLMVRAA